MVVAAYEKPLFSYVYRLVYNKSAGRDPEDIVQEVFLKAYTRIRTFDPVRGSFTGWLFAIARNHCLSLLRKKSIDDRLEDLGQDEVERIIDRDSPTPREVAWERDVSRIVAAAVSALPEKLKSAFLLRHYQDLSYEEIAVVMECNIGTAKSRVARAKDRLARELEGLSVIP